MLKNQIIRKAMHTSLFKFIAFSFCSFLFLMPVYAAEVYKWVDKNGVVTYSQKKPSHTESHALTTSGPPPSVKQAELQARAAQQTSNTELSTTQRQDLADLEQKEADRISDETARKASNCTLFSNQLSELTAKERVRVREADNSMRILPEEERQERITAAKREIELNCN